MKTVNVSTAQDDLPALLRKDDLTLVMRNGLPAGFIVPYERMQAMVETMEILANPDARKALRDADNPRARRFRLEDIP